MLDGCGPVTICTRTHIKSFSGLLGLICYELPRSRVPNELCHWQCRPAPPALPATAQPLIASTHCMSATPKRTCHVACWRRGSSAPVVLAADLLLGVGPRADVGAVQRGRQRAPHGQVALQDLRVHRRVLAAARQVPAALAALPRACTGSA